MTNNYQTTGAGQGGGAAVAVAGADIVVDKNKLAEQYIKEAEAMYIVPTIVRQKFPDLIKLIYETESMNKEEREYWLQIMPIMTEDQIVKFRDILVNERDQLAKLDAEYKSEVSGIGAPQKEIDEAKLKQKLEIIKKEEVSSEAREQSDEDELLKKLEEI